MNSDSAKREKVCHLRTGIYIWNYYGLTRKGVYRDGGWKSDCHLIFLDNAIFFVTEAGKALAALGYIHEGDSHILK